MEEQEVDREVLVADLDGVFRAHEAEVSPELGDEAAEVAEQRAMEVGLGVVAVQGQELEVVGVLQLIEGRWVCLCHRW